MIRSPQPHEGGRPVRRLSVRGHQSDGHRYRGIVQIAAVRNTYLVRWTLADDVEVMGVGILQDGHLSVSYFGGTPAVVVKIGTDKLVGEWTMGGTEGRVYAETLTRVPEGSLPKPQPQQQRPPRQRRAEPVPGNTSPDAPTRGFRLATEATHPTTCWRSPDRDTPTR